MFEGIPDQFHQFIASSRSSLPAPPLSFPPLHHASSSSSGAPFPSFDPYSSTSASEQVPAVLQPAFLRSLHQGSPASKTGDKQESNTLALNLEVERDHQRSVPGSVDSWSNDEVLAMLRIRSSMENWFPEFTWEHVSSKLAELGFRRSAETCKEKFEEESRCFSSSNNNHDNNNYSKNYRAFTGFEELYDDDGDQNPRVDTAAEKNNELDNKPSEEQYKVGQDMEDDSKIDQTSGKYPTHDDGDNNGKDVERSSKSKKRKRGKKFEMFRGFFEDIVHRMMAQQEQMHNKLLEDMLKRDEEKLEREEAWKKKEMDRFNKELELRAHEQAIAGERQAKIIKFLTKFASSGASSVELLVETSTGDLGKLPTTSNHSTSSSPELLQNPNNPNDQGKNAASTSPASALPAKNSSISPGSMAGNQEPQNPSSTFAFQSPNTSSIQHNLPAAPTASFSSYKVLSKSISNDKDDIGKRWPRDEVLALINLRCSLYNNNEDKEGSSTSKAPLWERISKGMATLGYERSAKRCKEKWENINKYFRKTKDVNKKRSMDSRTCPYFYQLSTLYNQGKLAPPPSNEEPENHLNSPPETRHRASPQNGTTSNNNSTMHAPEGEKDISQVPAFEFGF